MPPTATGNPSTATAADRAFVRAVRAWGQLDAGPVLAGPGSFWSKLSPAYRDRLADAWTETGRLTPERAWQALLDDQRASARFDPGRVHPSWFVRILEAESPAVRHLVAQFAPGPVRAAVRGRSAQDGEGNRAMAGPGGISQLTADPGAVGWALGLWSERLVGDVVEAPGDPPIIAALTQLGFRDQVRLARAAGQVKQAFALADAPGMTLADDVVARTNPTGRVRIAFFRRTIGRADPRLVPLARGDLAAVTSDSRQHHAAVGLITLARLLKGIEAHRARWAIQHIPYPIARRIGGLGGSTDGRASGLPSRAIRAWELWVLEAAWARLLAEGRFGGARS